MGAGRTVGSLCHRKDDPGVGGTALSIGGDAQALNSKALNHRCGNVSRRLCHCEPAESQPRPVSSPALNKLGGNDEAGCLTSFFSVTAALLDPNTVQYLQ